MTDDEIDKILRLKALEDKELARIFSIAPAQTRDKYRERQIQAAESAQLEAKGREVLAEVVRLVRLRLVGILGEDKLPANAEISIREDFFNWVAADRLRSRGYSAGPSSEMLQDFVEEWATRFGKYWGLRRAQQLAARDGVRQAVKNAEFQRGRQWVDMSKFTELAEEDPKRFVQSLEPGMVVSVNEPESPAEEPVEPVGRRYCLEDE